MTHTSNQTYQNYMERKQRLIDAGLQIRHTHLHGQQMLLSRRGEWEPLDLDKAEKYMATRHNAVYDTGDIFDFIVKFKRENDGNSPTVREIALRCDVSSTSVVNHHLQKLEQVGLISRSPESARAIRVTGGRWEMTNG